MALAKTIETEPRKIDANYWKIGRINLDFINGYGAEVYVGGYESYEQRNKSLDALTNHTVSFREEEYTDEIRAALDVIRTAFYEKLTESKTETRDTGEVDKEGNPVTDEVETNLFANAELA